MHHRQERLINWNGSESNSVSTIFEWETVERVGIIAAENVRIQIFTNIHLIKQKISNEKYGQIFGFMAQ